MTNIKDNFTLINRKSGMVHRCRCIKNTKDGHIYFTCCGRVGIEQVASFIGWDKCKVCFGGKMNERLKTK